MNIRPAALTGLPVPRLTSLKLAQIALGQEHPLADYNMRVAGRSQPRPDLLASLRDKWVLQPLICTSCDGEVLVYAIVGNSRVENLRLLAEESPVLNDRDVPCVVYENLTREQAFAIAAAEVFTTLPPHPVDQYVAFEIAAHTGAGDDDIAARYGITPAKVRQRRALGALSPKVLDAWRGGAIDQVTAEAFTLAANDFKRQNKVFEQLDKTHALQAHSVRAKFLPAQGEEVASLVEFVGVEAYEARGGQVIRDLFQQRHGVSDAALAKAMAEEKLAAECERLMAEEGWKWVAPASSLPADWHGWDQSKPKVTYTDEQKAKIAEYEAIMARTENDDTDAYPDARSAMESLQAKAAYDAMSPRQRAKSGVAVEIGAQGKLVRYFGLIKPEPKAVEPPPPAAAPTGKVIAADPAPLNEPEPEPRISGALATRLAAALTTASAQTLRADPNLALCVVIAGLMQNSSTAAVRLMHDGAGSRGLTWSDETFAKALGRVVRMKMDQRLKLLAEIAAASLSFHAHSAEHRALDDADTAAVVNAMNPKDLAKALKLAFDPDDYFKAVPKAMSATAIAEGMGKNAPDAETLAGMDKATLVETALREIPDTWLPAELRPLAYDGPAAKPKRKPSKAAKKKAKR